MKSKNLKSLIGTILVTIGIIFIVIGLGFEAINYPWALLFNKDNTTEILAVQPKELGQPFAFFDPTAVNEAEKISTLPASNNALPMGRANKELSLIGTIRIPKIGIVENIVEGADDEILYAVGHLPGSAIPGQAGNSVLAGHRNYVWMHPFKYLNKMEKGDKFFVDVYNGSETLSYTYEIYDIVTVKPEDVWVTGPQEGEEKIATLITCTPIPSYTERLVCFARLVEDKSANKEQPAAESSVAVSPVPEQPATESSVAESPAPEQPAVESSVAVSPTPEQPAVESSVAESPAPEQPASEAQIS